MDVPNFNPITGVGKGRLFKSLLKILGVVQGKMYQDTSVIGLPSRV